MRTLSLDLRERIVEADDQGDVTRTEVAQRFRVSLGMVKKLLQQRRRTGDLAPRHRFAGRKPMIVATHRTQIRSLLAQMNDLTLSELRAALGLACSVQALHVVRGKMDLTYNKRRSAPANKTGRTLAGRGGTGGAPKRAWIGPPDLPGRVGRSLGKTAGKETHKGKRMCEHQEPAIRSRGFPRE